MTPTRGGDAGSQDPDPGSIERIRQVLIRAVERHCPVALAAHREDLVQMALIRLLERPRGEGSTPRGASYLWRVAYTVVIDEIRRFRRQQRQAEQLPEGERRTPGPEARAELLGLPRGAPGPPPHRRHPAPGRLPDRRGGRRSRLDREAGRESRLPWPRGFPRLPRRGRHMTGPSDDLEQRFRAALPDTGDADCPPPDAYWAAAAGELPFERVRALVDHGASCAHCAEAWRILADVRRAAAESGAAEDDPPPMRSPIGGAPARPPRGTGPCSRWPSRPWPRWGSGSCSVLPPSVRRRWSAGTETGAPCARSLPRSSPPGTRCCAGPRSPARRATT